MRTYIQKLRKYSLTSRRMAFSLLVGLAHNAAAVNGDKVVVDLFTEPQVASDVVEGGAGDFQSTGTGIPSILGGQRDIFVNALSGTNDVNGNDVCDVGDKCAVMSISSGTLRFNNDTGVTGEGIVQWDGDDQDIALVPDGLGGFDLTAGGTASGLEFTIDEADQTFVFTIEAYTDATHFTIFTIQSSVVAPGFPITRTIPFTVFEETDFCGDPGATGDPQILNVECGGTPENPQTADLSNLGALQVQLNLPDENQMRTVALDLKIQEIVAPKEEEDGQGRVSPTGTTCEDFVNDDPDSILESFDMRVRSGSVFNVTPGAAFYFTRFDFDPSSSDFIVDIVQSSTGGPDYEMDLTTWQLFEVVATDTGFECEIITQDSFADPTLTDQTLDFTGLGLPSGEYAMRIRMNPKSIEGETDPGSDLTNNFQTLLDGNLVDQDPDGVLLDRNVQGGGP
ncbi:hypothetical protein [Methylohalobius crimeensis]|uniref:hypothetical protein n=1 Tax=Methylohalobius crimeensis TaxID=244365 RepID=UPI0003B77E7D|nr:hypothetical protein [Methylohalobius crimeensis]